MPSLDPSQLSKPDRHRLVIGSVVPRPIAWITTQSISDGGEPPIVNLAPFSFFMGVTSSPPTIAVSIGSRSPVKDTLANLRASGEAVVHLTPAEHLETVNQTGAEYASDVSEIDALGLDTLASVVVAPPRLAIAEVALECRLQQEVHIGSPGATLCVLEIVHAHVADAVAGDDGLPDPRRLSAVARLGGRAYLRAEAWDVAEQPPPNAPDDQSIRRG